MYLNIQIHSFLGIENQNRAVNGDTVAIELLEKKFWENPSEIVLEDDAGKIDVGDTLDDDVNDKENSSPSSQKDINEAQPTAKIVGIIKRKW